MQPAACGIALRWHNRIDILYNDYECPKVEKKSKSEVCHRVHPVGRYRHPDTRRERTRIRYALSFYITLSYLKSDCRRLLTVAIEVLDTVVNLLVAQQDCGEIAFERRCALALVEGHGIILEVESAT